MDFANRKEQIEQDFLKTLMRQLKQAGCQVNHQGRKLIAEELKSSAMVGAVEERHRTLEILKPYSLGCVGSTIRNITDQIISESVLKVLGYEE